MAKRGGRRKTGVQKQDNIVQVSEDGIRHLGNESWATCVRARRLLAEGHSVSFVGIGQSMHPFIPNGTRCLLTPVDDKTELKKKDAVFCKVRGGYLLHRIRGFKHSGRLILIGNNHGHIDGWTTRDNVYGKYVGAVTNTS